MSSDKKKDTINLRPASTGFSVFKVATNLKMLEFKPEESFSINLIKSLWGGLGTEERVVFCGVGQTHNVLKNQSEIQKLTPPTLSPCNCTNYLLRTQIRYMEVILGLWLEQQEPVE